MHAPLPLFPVLTNYSGTTPNPDAETCRTDEDSRLREGLRPIVSRGTLLDVV